ncbi:MAG: restriction endonuclease [Terracidiphilus sp.]|jgi:hypothetical protein
MTTAWREFEKLVARIEQAMAPSGAEVKSPDRIPDKITGQLREVDASIRYRVGTCPILITIECRDRSSSEDVRWIEQLAEKKRSVGAAMTIAVSSSGFSESAVKKAAASDIEIRTLADATPNEFVQWLKFQNVALQLNEWSLADLGLDLYDGPQGPPPQDTELSSTAQQSFREKGPLAPIFIRNSDGKGFHIENILTEWCKLNGTFFPPDLPPDGSKVRRNLHQPMERNCLHVETTNGNFDIRIIHISVLLCRSSRLVPLSKLAEYSDQNSPLVQTAEWLLMDKIRLSLHRDLASGETKVSMVSVE